MNMIKYTEVLDPANDRVFRFVIADSMDEVCKAFPFHYEPKPEEYKTALAMHGGMTCPERAIHINVLAIRADKCTINSVMHECLHATIEVFRFHGVKLTRATEEAFATYHGWLCNEAIRAYTELGHEVITEAPITLMKQS